VTRFPLLALFAALAAPPAFACAPMPPQEAPATSACAAVLVHPSQACIDDPSSPGGYRIVSAMEPSLPDCATGVAGGCVMPMPEREPGAMRRVLAYLPGL
jgi:hypothetical protein